jgi:hypothetical protein
VAQGIGPEFKPQYHKKKRERNWPTWYPWEKNSRRGSSKRKNCKARTVLGVLVCWLFCYNKIAEPA